jgi:site-specific recombinase XerD
MATIIERMNKKTNLPSYRVQIRHHGRYLKRTGTNKSLSKTFHTKREAELYAASLEQDFREKRQKSKELDRMFREGIYVGQKYYDIMADLQKPAKPSEVLFAQVIQKYEEEVQIHKAWNTQNTQKNQLRYWDKRLGYLPLTQITPSLINEEKVVLFDQGKKSSTVRRYLVLLNHILNVCTNEWQLLDKNPASQVKKPADAKGRTRFLSQKEIATLLEACKTSTHWQLYPICTLALATGARYSEIVKLPLKQISFEREVMILKDTKNKTDRSIPLSPFAATVLKDYVHELVRRYPHLDPDMCLLFPSKNGKTPAYIRKVWRQTLKNCGITDYHFHDNRHTFSSHLVMNGASLIDTAHILGHKTLAMVQRYAHLSEPHTRNLLEKTTNNMFQGL